VRSVRIASYGRGRERAVWQTFTAFVRLGRPLFLTGGFVNYGLGAVIARLAGHAIDVREYALGQGAVTAFQLMTHYANDYFDLDADRANTTPTRWSGGSRVLPAGELPRSAALIAALVLAAIGIALIVVIGERVPVLVATGALAWAYSAPPLRLCARGLGELDTAVVVTGLVPWLGFALQAPDLRGATVLLAAIAPAVLLQFSMLLAIEFPDAAGDAATGKRTLVVRLGAPAAAKLYAACTAAAYLWLPFAWRLGVPAIAVVLAAFVFPIGVWRIARIADHRDRAAHERMTFFAVAQVVAVAAAMLAGVTIAA
jgi:1,4-dihydroxy-2-naphthoate octaprenyltransferase